MAPLDSNCNEQSHKYIYCMIRTNLIIVTTVCALLQALTYLKIGTCPASQKLLTYMDKILIYISLALQPEALVNTSGRVDFSSPVL